MPWVRSASTLIILVMAGWGLLEVGQRYFGIQRLVIEQIDITGCQWDRLSQVQQIADELCIGKPLFFFDSDLLQERIESLRWVRACLIRRAPPDRLSIVIAERQPVFMLSTVNGVLLMSEEGIVMDRLDHAYQVASAPIPVIVDPASLNEESILNLIRAARSLKSFQPDFYARLTEMRWSNQGTGFGPTVFLEGLSAPIYLSKDDPSKNIPNFQALYLQIYAREPDLEHVRYFDLRWEGIRVADSPEAPATQAQKKQ